MGLQDNMIADLAAFFDISGFAELATYSPSGGSPVQIAVIYDHPSKQIPMDMGVICSTNPQIRVRDSDVPGIGKKDTFTVRGILYKVSDVDIDGTGITTVTLSK